MAKHLQDTTTLHNGVKMPWLGLGVFKVEEGPELVNAVKTAIVHGYRSVDTAAIYENEAGVGEGIREGMKEARIAREELFITSKVWNADLGYESTIAAYQASLDKLGLDYLDLYLIHWPVAGKYKEAWRALETLYKEGRVKAIGVSNFQIHHLEDLMKDAEIKPMVNQVEYHPRLTQKNFRRIARSTAFSWKRGRRSCRGNCWIIQSCRRSQQSTANRLPRSFCAGTCKTESLRSPNRQRRSESSKTLRYSILS